MLTMPQLVTRRPNSLPNYHHDARSDYSTGSRATVSTTAARHYQYSNSNNNNNQGPHHPYPPTSYDLSGVSANFVLDSKDDESFQVVTSGGYGCSSKSARSHRGRQFKEGKTHRKTQGIQLKHTPAMLLPEKEKRRSMSRTLSRSGSFGDEEDISGFVTYISNLRQNSVVPNDPDKLPMIMAPVSPSRPRNSIEDLLLHRSTSSGSLSDSVDGSDSRRDPGTTVSSTLNDSMGTETNDGEYIDTFSDKNDIAKFRWALLKNKFKSKRMRKQSVVDQQHQAREDESVVSGSTNTTGLECPICAKAAQSLGSEEALFTWILDKLSPKRNLFPRYSSITRGTIPHFCNFVKKVKLKEKDNDKPQPDHTHTRHRDLDSSQDGASSNPAHMSSSYRGSHDNISGRPSSPASTADSTGHHGNTGSWPQELETDNLSEDFHDVSNSKQKPEIPLADLAVHHISVPTGPSSPEPVSPPLFNGVTSGDVKLSTIEDDSEHTINSGKGSGNDNDKDCFSVGDDKDLTTEPGPPQKVNRTTLIEPPPMPAAGPHNSPYPHQNVPAKKPRAPIVKKEKKPFERQRQEKQGEEVVEVKMEEPAPEPEVIEVVKSPEPPPKPKVEAVVPELPTFKEKEPTTRRRMGSSRAGKQGIKFMSPFDDPDADKDTLENMKEQRKAFELTVPEIAKEDFSQQKPRMQSWLQARLALSQQSSRFEIPMDIKTLEKMSAQDYLKKHCVISTRRSALYHKVHARYKEKGGVIHVKDLDKALQDVLVSTITSEDTKHICEVVGLQEDGTVDFKLFGGIAAMAERMLYPKFVTDDTADMKEFKKETIECADFSALDWKLHGVNINPQVHTILKSL